MNDDGIGAGGTIALRTPERLGQAVPGDERLGAGDEDEVGIAEAVTRGFELAAELVGVGEFLNAVAQEAVRLWEELVLDANTGDAALLKFADEAAEGVEIAVAGVAIDEDRDARGVGHELGDLEDLRPTRLVVVAHAERGGDGEAAGPDRREAGLLGDLGREAVVRLHDEGERFVAEERFEAGCFFQSGSR